MRNCIRSRVYNYGDYIGYCGGQLILNPSNLVRAISITENELKRDKARFRLFKSNPQHESFAHDMKWFGPEIIESLLRGHITENKRKLKALIKLCRTPQLNLF